MLWQDEPLSPSRLPGAGCPTQGPQTAPGASGGTAAPGTPDPYAVPSLTDKAPGIYETLGPNTVLHRVVELALRTGSDAGKLAAQFTELLDAGYSTGLRLNQLTDANSGLAARLGRLLACIDVVLAAAYTPQAVHNRAEDLRRGYYLEYQALLRQAEQRGLASGYTSAPMREAQRKACGLRRPAFIEKGETHE